MAKKPETRQKKARLSPGVFELVERLCDIEGVSFSRWVNDLAYEQACEYFKHAVGLGIVHRDEGRVTWEGLDTHDERMAAFAGLLKTIVERDVSFGKHAHERAVELIKREWAEAAEEIADEQREAELERRVEAERALAENDEHAQILTSRTTDDALVTALSALVAKLVPSEQVTSGELESRLRRIEEALALGEAEEGEGKRAKRARKGRKKKTR